MGGGHLKKFLVAAIVAAAFYGAPAVAAPPAAPMFNWTGFYIGANGGYGFGSTTSEIPTTPVNVQGANAGEPFPVSLAIHPKGFFGGVGAGYNWQTRNFLFGFEGDIQISEIKSDLATYMATIDTGGHPHTDWHNSASENLKWFGTIRARTGLVFDRFLAYVTGGLAFGGVKVYTENAYNFNPINWYTSDSTMTRFGWTIGGGGEYALANRWTFKAEYLYYDLGTINSIAVNHIGISGYVPSSLAVHGNLVRAGVNYKF